MLYVVLGMLNEVRPVWYFVLAMVLFVLSQLDYFLLNKVICKVSVLPIPPPWCVAGEAHVARAQGTSAKVDGSFVATILETAAVGVLYLAWRSITEGACSALSSRRRTSVPRSAHCVCRVVGRRGVLPAVIPGAARIGSSPGFVSSITDSRCSRPYPPTHTPGCYPRGDLSSVSLCCLCITMYIYAPS